MNKIRLGSKTKITLEVNDKGETISFDFADPAFLHKAQMMASKAQQVENDFKEQFKEIGALLESSTDEVAAENMLDDDMIAIGEGFTEFYGELRTAIDSFLGEGASQKIYGDDNYFNMFNDLFDALKPYIDKGAKLQQEEIKEAKKEALKKIPKDNKRSL